MPRPNERSKSYGPLDYLKDMKTAVFVLTFSLSFSLLAQKPLERLKVVEVDTVSPAEVLRGTARKWFADSFKDANSVIQMDDAATNTIMGKGWSEFGTNASLHYSIEVQCKKGRVRVRVYDVRHEGVGFIGYGSGAVPAPSWGMLFDEERCYVHKGGGVMEKRMFKACEKYRPEIAARLDSIIESIEKAMLTKVQAANSDW